MPKFTIPTLCNEAQEVLDRIPKTAQNPPIPLTRDILYQRMMASKHLLPNSANPYQKMLSSKHLLPKGDNPNGKK